MPFDSFISILNCGGCIVQSAGNISFHNATLESVGKSL
jgi:hypothetical protein